MSTMRSSGLLGVSIQTSFGRERQRRRKSPVVGLIDELNADDAALREVAEQAIRAAVTVVRRDQQIVRSEQLHDQVNRRHARTT